MNVRYFSFILIFLFIYIAFIFLGRHPLIVDDVTPWQSCNPLIRRADIVYVIPFSGNHSIAENPEWCAWLREQNKTLGMHGIWHSYHEFEYAINEQDLRMAFRAFHNCSGQDSALFRPPYNIISPENKKLVESLGMVVYNKPYYAHPYCHCSPLSYMHLLNWALWC